MKFRSIIFVVAILVAGCIPAYKPPGDDKRPVVSVTPIQAFDEYRLDTASNFRSLAQRCSDGEFEYVSQMVDVAVELDHAAKVKRSRVIDKMVADALGSDELDKDKAADVLTKIADNLDPQHKVQVKKGPTPIPVPARK